MKTKEKLQVVQAHWQASEIVLVREGLFWHAYEHSAFALCKFVHPFKVSVRYVKCVVQWVCYVGFPNATKDKWLASREVNTLSEELLVFRLTDDEKRSIDENYSEWKHLQVAKANESIDEIGNHSMAKCEEPVKTYGKQEKHSAESQVLQMVRNFVVENATPLTCMNFIANIKQILYEEKV